jgi:hypothetical protein
MSGLLDLVSQHLGDDKIENIAKQLGASPEQTKSAIGMALPTLLGAVSRKADNENDVQELHRSLEQHQGSGILDQLGGLLGGGAGGASQLASGIQALGGGDMGSLLGGLLGGRKDRVQEGIGKASGMNASQVGSLLAMLAPLVMGALARKAKTENMDAGGLAGMLRGERKSMENQASGGLLAGLLDQDGDGDFDFSDIMKLGTSYFGRK